MHLPDKVLILLLLFYLIVSLFSVRRFLHHHRPFSIWFKLSYILQLIDVYAANYWAHDYREQFQFYLMPGNCIFLHISILAKTRH